MLRDAPLDLGGDVAEQRVIFEEMMAAIPVPTDVTTSSGNLGGIPVVNVEAADADPAKVIFYLHGGAYAIGRAASSVGLASDLARRAGSRLVTVDYRLAPEHPHPAAIDDAVAAYHGLLESSFAASAIAIAGESAGAGLAATGIPFGGGRRRCIGATFAQMEMKIVLPALLSRCELTAGGTSAPELARRRSITFSPRKGGAQQCLSTNRPAERGCPLDGTSEGSPAQSQSTAGRRWVRGRTRGLPGRKELGCRLVGSATTAVLTAHRAGIVGLAGHAADRQEPYAVGPRQELASRGRPDADDVVGV
jgi:hypothetical protein